MSWPAQSSFQDGASQSLWWKARYDGAVQICASQGRTIIKLAQRQLRRVVPVDSFSVDGVGSYDTRDLVADGIPGEVTQAATVWLLSRMGITSLLTPVRADFDHYRAAGIRPDGAGGSESSARGLPLSQGTCAAFIWIAQETRPDLSMYEFPTFIPPLWRTSSPDSGPEVVVCFAPSVVPPRTTTDTTRAPSGTTGGAFNPYDLASFGASSVLGGAIGPTTPAPTARKSKAGAAAFAAAVALAVAAAAEKKRKR